MGNTAVQTPPQTPPGNFLNVSFICKIETITMQCVPTVREKCIEVNERV